MEKRWQHPHRQKHIEIFGKNSNRAANGKQPQNKDHHPLAIKSGHKERHGRPCHRYPQGKQADKPTGLHHTDLIVFRDIGQNPDKAHFGIENAKYTRGQDKQHYAFISILFHFHTFLFFHYRFIFM